MFGHKTDIKQTANCNSLDTTHIHASLILVIPKLLCDKVDQTFMIAQGLQTRALKNYSLIIRMFLYLLVNLFLYSVRASSDSSLHLNC